VADALGISYPTARAHLAAVFRKTGTNRQPALVELLQANSGLTPMEARLAARLAAGEEVSRAAAVLGIRYATARGYLAAVFRKTGARRQGELVRLLQASVPASRG